MNALYPPDLIARFLNLVWQWLNSRTNKDSRYELADVGPATVNELVHSIPATIPYFGCGWAMTMASKSYRKIGSVELLALT